MPRIGRALALLMIPLALAAWPCRRAAADLIRPAPDRSYPEIAADLNGSVTYTFDPASKTGTFHAENTPYLLASGPTLAGEVAVQPTADGVRKQTLDVTLDGEGRLLDRPTNSFEMYGTVVANGQTYTGLLLKGVPTAFGSEPADPLGVTPTPTFDLAVKITGGQLAGNLGPGAYLRIMPTCDSTFDGSFQKDFAAQQPVSNIRPTDAPFPFPAPEPAALAVLLAGGAGIFGLNRLRSLRKGR